MNIETLRKLCSSMPGVTEDIKWGNDLVFSVGNKMFCVAGLHQSPASVSFKVTDEEFEECITHEGFIPAPYLARHKWVHIDSLDRLNSKEWKKYAEGSYQLVFQKLPAKVKAEIQKGKVNSKK